MAKLRLIKVLVALLAVLAVIGIARASGLYLNHSASYPRGLWQKSGDYDPTHAGEHPYVLACAPGKSVRREFIERGYLPWGFDCDGVEALLKRIWAVAGDRWTVTAAGIKVNGQLVPNTQPLTQDSAGRSMPVQTGGIVPVGHVLLLSDYHPRSFDGRYFGTTPIKDLISEVSPLWTELP